MVWVFFVKVHKSADNWLFRLESLSEIFRIGYRNNSYFVRNDKSIKKQNFIPGQKNLPDLKDKKGGPFSRKPGGHSSPALADIEEFQQLKQLSGITLELLSSILGTTARNIQYKKTRKAKFDLPLTDRLRKLIQFFMEGIELFGTNEQLNEWLKKPSYALDYTVPFELLGEPGGLDRLLVELSAIKYGDAI
jgi:uncharacterized protein (DUF2384 family)